MYWNLHFLGRVLEISHPGTCIAHLGTCIVLWGGCISEITLQMLGGIDSVRINTPPPWKKEWTRRQLRVSSKIGRRPGPTTRLGGVAVFITSKYYSVYGNHLLLKEVW